MCRRAEVKNYLFVRYAVKACQNNFWEMRGQRLFVRPIDRNDHDSVRTFMQQHGDASAVPECGLVGKLVGELVAVMSIRVTGDAIRIEDLLVAPELRRKRIGRVMLEELNGLAAKMERDWLIVEKARGASEFFKRVGFIESDNQMVRRVRR
jgi:GNAT superfamily N-acetyltransferase